MTKQDTTARYEVRVIRWSDEHQAQVEIVAGEFTEFHHARIFAKAYSETYHATAKIVEHKQTEYTYEYGEM